MEVKEVDKKVVVIKEANMEGEAKGVLEVKVEVEMEEEEDLEVVEDLAQVRAEKMVVVLAA